MSVEARAIGFIHGELEKVANNVKHDMVSIVSRHSISGRAVSAIKIEKLSNVSYFIGAHINFRNPDDGGLHLYYLDEGNGGGRARIRPRRAKALKTPYGLYHSVSGYDGIHFVREVAQKYGD